MMVQIKERPFLRILMISPQFRPIVGGYERAAERLSVALAARGHAVTVITERRDRSWPSREAVDGYVVKRLPCFYRPRFHTITSLLSFAFFLLTQGFQFHVWHVHQYGLHAAMAAVLGKILRRPVALKLTSSGVQGVAAVISDIPMSKLAAFALRRVEAVIATTRETMTEAKAFEIPIKRIHLLGNGVDTQLFRPRTTEEKIGLRRSLGIEAMGLVLFVGRLAHVKNPEGLLRAWQSALSGLQDGWRLVLVGDGPLCDRLKFYIATSDLVASVIMAGYRNDIDAWMAAADIYVMASHNEGLSNTMLEAMSSGLPVVATQVSGTTELLKESGAGIVVDIGRMDQLADVLVSMANSEQLRIEMGHNGRKVVEDRYSIASVAQCHEELYSMLCKPR